MPSTAVPAAVSTAPEPASAARLRAVLTRLRSLTIAVSGGVDSMTLAHFAHRAGDVTTHMAHALSPAVPNDGTARVRAAASAEGWALTEVDAGEFDDPRYIANPVNRCYYCKSHLYDAMAACRWGVQDGVLASGTNLDDLADYRPGLEAAAERSIVHPFVEAHCSKADVREIAAWLGLGALAELPASPCLSSRVQTGIPIDPRTLKAIHSAEQRVAAQLAPGTVRCRVREGRRVVLELDAESFGRLTPAQRDRASSLVSTCFEDAATVTIEPYRMGSAFVHGPA